MKEQQHQRLKILSDDIPRACSLMSCVIQAQTCELPPRQSCPFVGSKRPQGRSDSTHPLGCVTQSSNAIRMEAPSGTLRHPRSSSVILGLIPRILASTHYPTHSYRLTLIPGILPRRAFLPPGIFPMSPHTSKDSIITPCLQACLKDSKCLQGFKISTCNATLPVNTDSRHPCLVLSE